MFDMSSTGNFKTAFKDHRELLMCGVLYIAITVLESFFCEVTIAEFSRVFLGFVLVILKCVILLVIMGGGVYLRGIFLPPMPGKTRLQSAGLLLDDMQQRYLRGEVFAQGCIGLLVIMCATFYFIQKSLLTVLHPFEWDFTFAEVDKFLHFGHTPDEFIVPLADKFHLGGLLDVAYFFWFAVMYGLIGFGLFWDNNRKRRLQLLWAFFLSWALLGSLVGTVFSAGGPVFIHDFYPHVADPYKDFVAYIDAHGPTDFSIAYRSRFLLLTWMNNGQMVNPNAVDAFPSMHLAIAWLAVLYARCFSRKALAAALAFVVLIYMATILFGFHYGVDGYVSIILMTLIWWAMGKYLSHYYPESDPPLRRV